jgi:hypothetical protein
MPVRFFPSTFALAQATDLQTLLALSVIKLFKFGFVPTPADLVASYDAQEADYSTYAPETITAFLAPVAAVGGGWRITAPTEQFDLAATPAVGNDIGGYWVETAAGDVVLVTIFDGQVPMSVAGNSVQCNPTVTVPTGA